MEMVFEYKNGPETWQGGMDALHSKAKWRDPAGELEAISQVCSARRTLQIYLTRANMYGRQGCDSEQGQKPGPHDLQRKLSTLN